MPFFFQALSKTTLYPAIRDKQKMILEQARPFFGRAGKIEKAESHYSLFRLNTETSEIPLVKQMEHLQNSRFSTKGLGDLYSTNGVKSHHEEMEMPKWQHFNDHIKELKQMYKPQEQDLKTSKSKRILPRVRQTQSIEQKESPRKHISKINHIKRQKIKIKQRNNHIQPSAKPLSSNASVEEFCRLLNGLLSRFVFRKHQAKRLIKFSRFNDKPRKIYKKDKIGTSKQLQKSLHYQRLAENEVETKLTKLWPALVELGELKGPKNPKRLSKKMRHKILKKLSRTALNLPTQFKDLLKRRSSKRSLKQEIKSSSTTKPKPIEIERARKLASLNDKFDYKLGERLKIHDYGFKYLKERASKLDASSSRNTPTDQLRDSLSPLKAGVISNRKVFRTMDTSLRSSTRQTAADMFNRANRSYRRNISSKAELLEQLGRLENLNHPESDSFEYFEETASASDLSEQINKKYASIKRINQSRAYSALSNPVIEYSPYDFFPYDDYQETHVPLRKKKHQPVKPLKKKQSKNCHRIPIPQTDAVTQTQCECEVCNLLQKYKTEKETPLVKEMAIKQEYLAQRQYYMQNVRHRKFKVSDNAGKNQRDSNSLIKSNHSDNYSQNRIGIANFEDTNKNLQSYKTISETFGLKNYKPQILKAYKEPDVTNILLRCYKTLFKAEQRTNEIFSNAFLPNQNTCRA
ncbi:uncharacterized protein [Drosophila takahashii]|uniref:uncharacterized protein n=1 Tax=Drosophila takahashii TaxID=29030 RepID=UPI003898E2A7